VPSVGPVSITKCFLMSWLHYFCHILHSLPQSVRMASRGHTWPQVELLAATPEPGAIYISIKTYILRTQECARETDDLLGGLVG
jgi:hypothetical protein